MGEHHSGTVHLTGQAQPDQPDPEETPVELTAEHLAAIANIWLEAGRKTDAYAKAQGWGHHPTIDFLREGPNKVTTFYDAAHHGQPDLTLEEAEASLAEKAEFDAAAGAPGADGGVLPSTDEMLAAIREEDPALADMLEALANRPKPKAKPES